MSQMAGPWGQQVTNQIAGALIQQVLGQGRRNTPSTTAPGQGTPPKKKSFLRTIIFWAIVFFVVIPVITSLLNSFNEQLGSTGYSMPSGPQTPYTPAPPGAYVPRPADLNPDEPPMPRTDNDLRFALLENPLYAQTITPIDCHMTDVDLVKGSPAAIEAHMNEFMECLMTTWHEPVTAANFSLPRPSVTVYTYEINTRCGQVPMYNAVYCSADQQVYYAKNLIEAFPPQLRQSRYVAESVIAHEFGHAIQYRTMILMSQSALANSASTNAEAMDTSRRLEMQADCFAGLYLHSISDSTGLTVKDRENIEAMFASLGGNSPYKDDHGMGTNRAAWAKKGLNNWSPGVCNTFTASEESVG
ncbi:MAG: neutral zinc metallopeptidase [Propionibacteriaceae bacterium]|nr:neutral zinc metallopeptidase [Propionibacteriaceae bacterium]